MSENAIMQAAQAVAVDIAAELVRKPKGTDAVKAKLESYGALKRKIDNQLQRLETLEASMGSTSS